MTTTIFVFQTAGRGSYTLVGATCEAEAMELVAHTDAELVGTVPADELFVMTATSPTILFKKEAAAIRASRTVHQSQSNV
jgi:hypothetical protein